MSSFSGWCINVCVTGKIHCLSSSPLPPDPLCLALCGGGDSAGGPFTSDQLKLLNLLSDEPSSPETSGPQLLGGWEEGAHLPHEGELLEEVLGDSFPDGESALDNEVYICI